eukprot:scpid87642/ scgid26032/ 
MRSCCFRALAALCFKVESEEDTVEKEIVKLPVNTNGFDVAQNENRDSVQSGNKDDSFLTDHTKVWSEQAVGSGNDDLENCPFVSDDELKNSVSLSLGFDHDLSDGSHHTHWRSELGSVSCPEGCGTEQVSPADDIHTPSRSVNETNGPHAREGDPPSEVNPPSEVDPPSETSL